MWFLLLASCEVLSLLHSSSPVRSQSCCTVAVMAKVLNSACTDTSVSQLSALLSLHRKLLLSQEERPSSMLKGAEDSLNSFSKVPGHKPPNSWFMDAVIPIFVNSPDAVHAIGAVMAFALNVLYDSKITQSGWTANILCLWLCDFMLFVHFKNHWCWWVSVVIFYWELRVD